MTWMQIETLFDALHSDLFDLLGDDVPAAIENKLAEIEEALLRSNGIEVSAPRNG